VHKSKASNPLLPDIRQNGYGSDDGKELFEKFQQKVDEYNVTNNEINGKPRYNGMNNLQKVIQVGRHRGK